MTNLPPSDPRRSRALGFDEFIGILVAFGAIGTVLWWGLSRNEAGVISELLPPPAADQPLADVFASPDEAASQAAGIATRPEERLPESASPVPTAPSPTSSPAPTLAPSPAPSPALPAQPAAPRPAIVPAPIPAGEPPALPRVETTPSPTLAVPDATASPVEFSDVPQNYWARPFIVALAQRGIITGFEDGTFQPDQPVNRSQYAALIETIFQSQTAQTPIAFKDIPANFWASPAIDTAVRTGFLKGYPDGTFAPDQPISRIQVLASLVNGLQVPQPSAPADVVQRYSDNDQIPVWAVPIAASATQQGMVVNYPTAETLNPNQPTTRAEVAALLYQALAANGKLEPIESNYIVRP